MYQLTEEQEEQFNKLLSYCNGGEDKGIIKERMNELLKEDNEDKIKNFLEKNEKQIKSVIANSKYGTKAKKKKKEEEEKRKKRQEEEEERMQVVEKVKDEIEKIKGLSDKEINLIIGYLEDAIEERRDNILDDYANQVYKEISSIDVTVEELIGKLNTIEASKSYDRIAEINRNGR